VSDEHFDVIVIGSGAGGGSVLHRLAPTGKRILVLERGGWMPRERENWDERHVAIEGRYAPAERWRDRDGQPFAPGVKYFVGGNTKVWGAATLRLRPSDFGEVRHAGGISPAWPLSYDELEPWYAEAEWLWGVRGRRGADPTEGPASAPYAHGPIRHEPRVAALLEGLERAGAHPWPLPLALHLDESGGATSPRSACIRCGTCDGFPCLVRGKADAEGVCVLPALAHPNVTLLTGARATRLEPDASGRSVRAVHVEHDGRAEVYRADVVVLACGAVNSAALLLRSGDGGLANASGRVGRNYMCHQNSAVFALSRVPNHSVLQKTWGLSDWYHAGPDWEFPMGLVQPLNRTPAVLLAHDPPGVEGYTPEYLATHSLEFWITSEDLPDPGNRVRLASDGGIVLDYRPNNVEAHARLARRLAGLLARVEGDAFDPDKHFRATRMPIGVCSHQCGTLRMGDDPRTSVLDRDCRAHDLDNLYVADASPFPSSGAVNPTLTILANALRVAERIRERLA
jgi:choline dehydrogenase-like flavoprotein